MLENVVGPAQTPYRTAASDLDQLSALNTKTLYKHKCQMDLM